MRRLLSVLICCSLIYGLSACGGSSDKSEPVTKDTYAKRFDSDWPWTVDKVQINCKGSGAFTITADGNEYYGNGLAKGRGLGGDLREIWADDPQATGLKISAGDFTQMANDFCGTD
ncbi:DUF2511 domain-containing protein [Bifidobacterium bombi]|uniref:Lipoprotein n=1 Tax=Bifidobacterium bombi DSM 19703 TaxID=1341695 RepID=A0A080N4B8_9BIFI|nr:DUF2511 domain-containing protein [Bifidobacterium bombi]KFF31215.1 hypothetical protein BBOMB_0552 [Bifidobacterium bombi DSM 19703]